MRMSLRDGILMALADQTPRGYSAHEYSSLYSRIHSANSSSIYALPLDIRIETIVSVFLICFGLVAGADPLKPINWNVWAGKIEREGGARNPFRGLEERAAFLDIRVGHSEGDIEGNVRY
jgi:membrane magnesium transporter 1